MRYESFGIHVIVERLPTVNAEVFLFGVLCPTGEGPFFRLANDLGISTIVFFAFPPFKIIKNVC